MSQSTTGIKLDELLRERLRELSALRDRSPHWLIKTALVEYLEREERYEQERREDEARWQRYQLTGDALSQQQAVQHFDKLRVTLSAGASASVIQEQPASYKTKSTPAKTKRKKKSG